METAIRWSQNSTDANQRFLHVNVAGRSVKLCRVKGRTRDGIDYKTISTHSKVPPFRAFDWSPTNEALVVVGQSSGEATVLRIDDGSEDTLSFQIRNQRLCNAVAFSTQGLLAAGLDKVRNDFCLNIWDLQQRLPSATTKGFGTDKLNTDPLHKLASSEPITSIKFFQDEPQTLVAGVKGQFVRLYDLREPVSNGALQFATRCVYNIAIDTKDPNYVASCYPVTDATICIWDRRYGPRNSVAPAGFPGGSYGEMSQPSSSLELKKVCDIPGQIWSLRFAKTRRGCLGMLSSTGHFKTYEMGKDHLTEHDKAEGLHKYGTDWEGNYPEGLFLNQSQDIERAYYHPKRGRDDKYRMVSFDFMTVDDSVGQPNVLTLAGSGKVNVVSLQAPPEPRTFSSLGFFSYGTKECKTSVESQKSGSGDMVKLGSTLDRIRRKAEPRNAMKQAFKHSKQNKSVDLRRISSFRNNEWNSDLGYFEKGVPLEELLTLSSTSRLRCEAGYFFSPAKNKVIVSDSHWLQSFWTWVERASKSARAKAMIQDNLDLSYLGVHDIWTNDLGPPPYRTRNIGPSSMKVTRVIENLARRLNISTGNIGATDYAAHRQLCLYVSGVAYTYEELESLVKRLSAKNQHTKAAAIATFADERKLVYKALRQKTSTQAHKMLAMAIAGAAKRSQDTTTSGEENKSDDDWSETIAALAEELSDPYARAILALVKSGDYEAIIKEESLPLKYRIGVALRWLSDTRLTEFISQATRDAVTVGDIEGVILTGIGTPAAAELMGNYVRKFGDLQTAVLGLSISVPRYVDDPAIVRRFENWRETYRVQINSWGLKYDRVRFDIGTQKLAMDNSGRRLIEPAKPQVALVCGFCSQSLAQFDQPQSSSDTDNNQSTGAGAAVGATTTQTQKHPLTAEKAAAIGTVCPKCGRHLPRCGVCDMWLGMPDPSYMHWYGPQSKAGSMDMSSSRVGSAHTTLGGGIEIPRSLGPQKSGNSAGAGRNAATNADTVKDMQDVSSSRSQVCKSAWEEMLRKFTVFCIKCSHGFHAQHAREWFGGYGGREGHRVCPVSDCSCVCDT